MDEIRRLINEIPSIAVQADHVKILETPRQFYDTLIALTRNAHERITLSTLYLGSGSLERNLVSELETALTRFPGLQLNILLDYLRGTREGEKSSAALLKGLVPRASVHLFHTPHLRGLLKKALPERTNEIVGLQHMKLYIFDDDVLISGANLSHSYFTNRQDRYVLIEKSPQLAEFFVRLVDAVSSCSFILESDGSIKISPRCNVHPYRQTFHEYEALIRSRIMGVLDSLPSASPFPIDQVSGADTRVFPLIQMGMFSLNQENDLLIQVFASQDTPSKMTLTSGYFNFVDDYARLISKRGTYSMDIICASPQDTPSKMTLTSGYFNFVDDYARLISKRGTYSMDIICASPQANGFYNGSGLSGYVPSLYVIVSEVFFRNKRPQVQLFEYARPEWTYHAKGLWIESKESRLSATLVGSSNYGYRSVHRDLEAQLLIVTSNEHLKSRLHSEHSRLMEWSGLVEASTFLRPDHVVPGWVRLFARYIRNFF
ncbi:CDP-diacylglycerol--glycerol-3-phosphate 3-phosphatidyltransferase, mitochondrial [Toxocara canis]|uniref:CDP-diacylglycerol--glycerol-3-phosphate 3-phosphatidyltransferase n=1 Tax=Toxocara canis TaxID=6265 RepID=A0A0B2V4G0_TOXCA|nr:CDP-diacylglycerol--glycerol-3-phosphate 3-phosphatidyltransferase, mitochondrial [Toxocara canis]